MNETSSILFLSLFASVVMACAEQPSDSEGSGGSAANGPSGSGAGPVCYDVEVNTSGDGQSACGSEVCDAGTYCLGSSGICDPGCRSTLGCGRDEFCDLSNANDDIGLCKKPGEEHEVQCPAGGSCADRCREKASDCGAPADITEQGCDYICPKASAAQVDCLESSSCAELGEAFESNAAICGIEAPE